MLQQGIYTNVSHATIKLLSTAVTMMGKTRIGLEIYIWSIHLVGNDKRGCSATMLSRELDISYKVAWLMLHKIRKAMGNHDSKYMLAGIVELDDAFFGSPEKSGKRVRDQST